MPERPKWLDDLRALRLELEAEVEQLKRDGYLPEDDDAEVSRHRTVCDECLWRIVREGEPNYG